MQLFRQIGNRTLTFFREIGTFCLLLARMISCTRYTWRDRKLILQQMRQIGVNSLPLVTVISIFTGAVSSWQAAYQFEAVLGGSFSNDYIGQATSAAIFIELAPVLVGIVIAGRVGASIAAELGTMRVTEQIDALETLAIDPIRYLATARFTAGWTMVPVLVIYASLIAHLGAYIVAFMLLNISTSSFFNSVRRGFLVYNVFSGLIKAWVFGGGTALIGCSIGFRTEGGAEGVGKSTIKSFVFAAAFILIADYILAMFLF